jgi:hypothetical protein
VLLVVFDQHLRRGELERLGLGFRLGLLRHRRQVRDRARGRRRGRLQGGGRRHGELSRHSGRIVVGDNLPNGRENFVHRRLFWRGLVHHCLELDAKWAANGLGHA